MPVPEIYVILGLGLGLGLILILIWNNYRDIQLIKKYQQSVRTNKGKHIYPVYPWWHGGYGGYGGYGGFSVGPWTWSRQQHFYHPGIGWYASPFTII